MNISKQEKIQEKQVKEISKLIYENIKTNKSNIYPFINFGDESDKFYYGLLLRQLGFFSDIYCLLSNQYFDNLTSIFIICRSILDDFMTLHYVCISTNDEEEITKLNACAVDKAYKKIKELADLNDSLFNGKFPYYPTLEYLEELKKRISENPDNDKYFKDKAKFEFKAFHTKRKLIDSYKGKDSCADLSRIYFIWRKLSDYVHYSKFSFDYFVQDQKPEYEFNEINEVLITAYYGFRWIIKQLQLKYNIKYVKCEKLDKIKDEVFTSINKF